MKIRIILHAIITVAVIVVLSMLMMSICVIQQIDFTTKKSTLMRDMVSALNVRRSILDEYLSEYSDISVIKWQLMQDATVKLLQSKEFTSREEQEILADMREYNVETNTIFSEIVSLHNSLMSQSTKASEKLISERKLISRLLAFRGGIADGANRLTEISSRDQNAILTKFKIFLVISTFIFSIIIFGILLLFKVKVLKRLLALQSGILIFGEGKLEHRNTERGTDEIGVLAHSFNEIAARMQESRAALERKMAESEARERNLKSRERQLLAKEHQLQYFVDNSPAAVAIFDTQMRYLFISDRWLEDYSVTMKKQELIGRIHYEVFPELSEKWRIIHKRALMGNIEKCEADSWQRADGKFIWVHWEVHPWYDEGGKVGGIFVFSENISERIKAESESRFLANIVADADDSIMSKDMNGIVLSWNPAAERMFGYPASEMIGQSIARIIPSEIEEKETRIFESLCNGKKFEHFDTERIRKDGSRIPVSISIAAIRDSSGRIVGASKIARDITERRLAQDRAEKLNFVLKLTMTGTWDWSLETDRLEWDAGMFAVFGISPETFKGNLSGFIELLHPDDREPTIRKVMDSIAKNADYEMEYRVIWLDKSVHYVLARGLVFRNIEGKPIRMAGICWDITKRKQDELAQLKTEQIYRVLMESAPDAILLIDELGKISSVNAQGENLFAYSKEELIGQDFEILIPKDAREIHVFLRSKFLRSPEARPMAAGRELSALTKDGRLIPVEISLSPGKAADDFFVMAVVRDISERKAAETQVHTLAAIAELSNDFMGICNPDMSFRYLNEAGMAMVGLSSTDEILKTKVLDLFWLEDLPLIENDAIPILLSEGRWNGACRLRNVKTGEPIYTIWNAFLIKDQSGKSTAWGIVSPNLNKIRANEDKIRTNLAEKEVLLQEIHHRVKNNLNVVSSLLELQAHNIQDSKISEVFHDCQNRVMSMALIHESLYQSQDLAELDFETYINTFIASLYHSYGTDHSKFAAKIDIHNVKFDIETAIPCSLIIGELVSNSLKYAFRNKQHGEISIEVRSGKSDDDWAYELVVADNGVGMPQNFSVEGSPSLGLKLVKMLTRQIAGNLTMDSRNGTRFAIHFGKPKQDFS